MSRDLIVERFQSLFQSSSNLGVIQNPDAQAESTACRGKRDHLFLYLRIEGSKIVDIRYECAQCDPTMYVTGDILCDLVRGLSIDDAMRVTEKDFEEELGEESQELLDHASSALMVLSAAISSPDSSPRARIMDHYNSPRHRGHLHSPQMVGNAENEICGDRVELQLSTDGTGHVTQAAFSGDGCPISMAAASMLTEHIHHRSLSHLRQIREEDMLAMLQTNLSPSRTRCALVALRALEDALVEP